MTAASPIRSLLPRNAAPRTHSGVLAHNCVHGRPRMLLVPQRRPQPLRSLQWDPESRQSPLPSRCGGRLAASSDTAPGPSALPSVPVYLLPAACLTRITRAPPDWLAPTRNTLTRFLTRQRSGVLLALAHIPRFRPARELAQAGPPVRSHALCALRSAISRQALNEARRMKAREGDSGPGSGSRAGEIRPDVSAGCWLPATAHGSPVPPAVALRAAR